MRAIATLAFLLFATLTVLVAPAHAAMQVVFGTSWDRPGTTLQDIVNERYGPGAFDVRTAYIGRIASQPDPFYWIDSHFAGLIVREVAGYAGINILGWYREPDAGGSPVIDGVDDGVVFDGAASDGSTTIVNFDRPAVRFGFYLDPAGPGGELFFTNRFFNDLGPVGAGALHEPFGGDAQALVYDVSRWTEPNTWLVAFDDLDSGFVPGPCCSGTDNDFNDFVFEVTALMVTPVQSLTFGALKARYR